MTQDTRKDRRAKIVSLNVRYKSATVDEFIENHSHDVSRGGIFIKTPTPFPPGTLLKFEIRIAGDKAVIAGVGRVVWKREALHASGETPAGMGVKFIKLDDSSRTVIDRLVDVKGSDVGAAFESGNVEIPTGGSLPRAEGRLEATPVMATPVMSRPAPAIVPPAPVERRAAAGIPFAPSPSSQMAAQRADAAGARKATIIGMGSAPPLAKAGDAAHHAAARAVAAKPAADHAPAASMKAGGSPMFPKTNSIEDMPPAGEQTVMKQAAELLEEALKGAGGSMEEIGTNPLFERAMKAPTPNGPTSSEPKAEATSSSAAASSFSPPKPAASVRPAEVSAAPARASSAPSPATAGAASANRRELSVRPEASTRSASAAPRQVSGAPAAEAAARGNRGLVSVLVIAAAGVLGYFAYTSFVPPSADSSGPVATAQPTEPGASALPGSPSTSASAEPVPAASAAASASAAAESASAAASPSGSAASPTTSAKTVTAALPTTRPPIAAPIATAKAPAPTATQAAPASTDDGAPTATAAPKPAPPKPTWKAPAAKPKSDDDNPY